MTEAEWEAERARRRRQARQEMAVQMQKRKDSGFSAESAVSTTDSAHSSTAESGEVRTRDFAVLLAEAEEGGPQAAKPDVQTGRVHAITNESINRTRRQAETPKKAHRAPETSLAIKAGKDDNLVLGLRRLKVTALAKLAGGGKA